jgi:hypothetical protein
LSLVRFINYYLILFQNKFGYVYITPYLASYKEQITMTNNSNKPTITVKEKSVYGNTLIYPVCNNAVIFAQLIGKKTFTANDLDLITALGFELKLITLN